MTPQETAELRALVVRSFTPAELRLVVRMSTGRELDAVSTAKELPGLFDDLLESAARRGWTDQLARGIVRAARANDAPRGLVSRFGTEETLEQFVAGRDPVVRVEAVNEALTRSMSRVLSVMADGQFRGTAFLIGPDLALTCHHVLRDFIGADGKASLDAGDRMSARFDFLNGRSSGRTVPLADDWLVAHSPHHELDLMEGDHDCTLLEDSLDFVVFRLASDLGNTRWPNGSGLRGWYHVSDRRPRLVPEDRLMIIQHPEGLPLSVDQDRVSWINQNGTRVRYRVNTFSGSSGSPGLDAEMNLAVLHHSAVQGLNDAPRANQGIPISVIAAKLRSLNLEACLTPPPEAPPPLIQLSRHEPIADREELQRAVIDFCRRDDVAILCVDGAPGTGRNYACRIVERVVFQEGHQCLLVELAAFIGASAWDLCEYIASALGADRSCPSRPADLQSSRWPKLLANWLGTQLRESSRRRSVPITVILDCTDADAAGEELRDLAVGLARCGDATAQVRVGFIGADAILPPAVHGTSERVRIGTVGSLDLARYLLAVAEKIGHPLQKEEADAISGQVFLRLPIIGPGFWTGLVQAMLDLRAELERKDG